MKNLSLCLALFLSVLLSSSAAAEGIFDVFGGNAIMPLENVNESVYQDKTGNQYATSYLDNVKMFNSPTGGFRVGGMHKWDHFSLGGAFTLEDYSAKAGVDYPAGWVQQRYPQGGNILQPAADLIMGIPLKFFRLYGGAGLTTPIMFYDYTGYDRSTNTIDPNSTGSSMSVGYNLFFGLRWLLTGRFNMFIEDRFSGLFSPMTIKNSFYDPANGFYDSSFTFNNIKSNRVVMGLGFQW